MKDDALLGMQQLAHELVRVELCDRECTSAAEGQSEACVLPQAWLQR